jgi:hypothetical protein
LRAKRKRKRGVEVGDDRPRERRLFGVRALHDRDPFARQNQRHHLTWKQTSRSPDAAQVRSKPM